MNQIKSTDYPAIYEMLGIDTGNLGCIMIDTEELIISDIIKDEDYYYSDEHQYVNGNVSEEVPHLTLLYGLMRSGKELRPHVDIVLSGWQLPTIKVKEVGFFYGHGGEYVTLVAHIEVTDELKQGHARLSLLPHINTFDEYHPHITLAYVKASSDWEQYIKDLKFKFDGAEIVAKAINYGS
jgi:2'-5' RNA ligase